MAFLLAETFPTFLLVGNHFVALNMVQDLCLYFHAYSVAKRQVAIGISQQYVREFYFVTSIATYVRHIQSLVFFHLKLLAGYFYYCEHNGSKIRTAKVQESFNCTNKILV